MYVAKAKIDAALLSKIMLARFLAMPLHMLAREVEMIESSPSLDAIGSFTRIAQLDGAIVAEGPSVGRGSASTLGKFAIVDDRLEFGYSRTAFVREFRFDELALASMRPTLSVDSVRLLQAMKLVNTRNRLTHAFLTHLLQVQEPYLRSGNPLQLVAMTQADMSRRMSEDASLPFVADAGRLSRLTRNLSVRLIDGTVLRANQLLPRLRELRGHWVEQIVKCETMEHVDGGQLEALSDEAIAQELSRQSGIRISRRSVSAIRQSLAIPSSRQRAVRKSYLDATEQFSPLLPLTPKFVTAHVPPQSGVYEIRLPGARDGRCAEPQIPRSSVLYIGSSNDLRQRLAEHWRGNSGNPNLTNLVSEGNTRVRYRLVAEGWRTVERDLYRAFCDTFGGPPPCNRMSP